MITNDILAQAPRTSLGGAASGVRRWLDRISERRQMKRLLEREDRVLDDIGVSRAEVRRRLRSLG